MLRDWGAYIWMGLFSEFCRLEWKIKIYMINKQKITLSTFDHINILLHLN